MLVEIHMEEPHILMLLVRESALALAVTASVSLLLRIRAETLSKS